MVRAGRPGLSRSSGAAVEPLAVAVVASVLSESRRGTRLPGLGAGECVRLGMMLPPMAKTCRGMLTADSRGGVSGEERLEARGGRGMMLLTTELMWNGEIDPPSSPGEARPRDRVRGR